MIDTAIVSAAIALAPQASASNQDDNFLALLLRRASLPTMAFPVSSPTVTRCAMHSVAENDLATQTLSQ